MPRPALLAAPLFGVALIVSGAAPAAVFVNELHYDNAGEDANEAIEVVATAGEDLSGYRLYLYNGSSSPGAATTYANDPVPTGADVTCGGTARIATKTYAVNALQNGGSDGIALVNASGQVVQFISYEGAITAADGPAAGTTSTNLPVNEPSNAAVGTSLQLSGSGVAAADFTWSGGAPQSFSACNAGQAFTGDGGGGDENVAPTLVSTTPVAGSDTFPAAATLSVTFSEPVTAAAGAFRLNCRARPRGGEVALTVVAQGPTINLDPTRTLLPTDSCTLTIDASKITDADAATPAAIAPIAFRVKSGSGGSNASGYYGRVNATSPDQLRCSLHEIIKGHTAYPYSGSGTSTWTILEIADEDPNNAGRILDVYKNRTYAKVSDRAGTGSGTTYNREHTWPNSLGFPSTTGDRGLPYAPYTDTHMLYLSDTSYNADRGNDPYADCSSGCGERPTESYNGIGGGSGTYPGNSNWTNGSSFQTWGQRKGDVARAVMYMAIRYEGGTDAPTGQSEPDLELTDDRSKIVGTSASTAYMGLLSTLVQWSQMDPPDAAERARNEVVFSFQGNRNPFIDHPEWATNALFTSARPATCTLGTGVPRGPRTRFPQP